MREATALMGQCILTLLSTPSKLAKWMTRLHHSWFGRLGKALIRRRRCTDDRISFLYGASTSILHRLIWSSIHIYLSVATDPSTQSCSLWRFSGAVTDKRIELRIAHGFLISVKSQSHFPNRLSQGYKFGKSDEVGRRFTWFSLRPIIFSLKHLSNNFSFVGRRFSGFGDWYNRPSICRSSAGKATVSRWSPDSF